MTNTGTKFYNKREQGPLRDNIRIEIIGSGFTAVEQVNEEDERTEKAKVLEIGDEVNDIEVGDTILFKAYNIDEIEVDGEKYIIIPEEDVKYRWPHATHS